MQSEVCGRGTHAPISWMAASSNPLDYNGPEFSTLWARSFFPLPEEWVDRPFGNLLKEAALRYASQLAIADGLRHVTYAELWREVEAVAVQLIKCVSADGVVAVLLPNSADLIIALLACLSARRLCLPLDLNYPPERNRVILLAASVSDIITTGETDITNLAFGASVQRIDMDGCTATVNLTIPLGNNDEAALVLYTSGTTGQPKGIVNSTAALLQRVLQYVNAGHLSREDQFLTLSSPCTIAGLRETLTPLLIGATLNVVPLQGCGFKDILNAMRKYKVTVYNSVPAIMRLLVAMDDVTKSFSTLRLIRLGGEALFWSDIVNLRQVLPAGCTIQIGYSSTELTGAQWFVPACFPTEEPLAPIGYLLPGNDAAIVDDSGCCVPAGEIGELWIRSRFAALGYWENGRLQESISQGEDSSSRYRIIATGDLVRYQPGGPLELVGRKDRQVKINGQRAEPAEVEAILRWSPHVLDAVVITRRTGLSTRFVAFVSPTQHAPTDFLDELRYALQAKLPRFMQPACIHSVNSLPYLPSGKPDLPVIERLSELFESSKGNEVSTASPSVPSYILTALEEAWRSILGSSALHINRNFYEAGGNSLGLMQLVFALEKRLGQRLPLDFIHGDMRIADIAELVAEAIGVRSDQFTGRRPLMLALPGIMGDEPRYATFRSRLKGYFEFQVLDTPSGRS